MFRTDDKGHTYYFQDKIHPIHYFSYYELKVPPCLLASTAGRVNFPCYPFIQSSSFIKDLRLYRGRGFFKILDLFMECAHCFEVDFAEILIIFQRITVKICWRGLYRLHNWRFNIDA